VIARNPDFVFPRLAPASQEFTPRSTEMPQEPESERTEIHLPLRLKRAARACAATMDKMPLSRLIILALREKLERERRKGRKFDEHGFRSEA
jgi:hypothetical protein